MLGIDRAACRQAAHHSVGGILRGDPCDRGKLLCNPIKNKAVAHYKRIWETHGIGWICEEMGHSKLDGYTNVISYYGSSEYDTRQMSRLIDLIVMECKEQGIETMTPRELALLKEGWKNG